MARHKATLDWVEAATGQPYASICEVEGHDMAFSHTLAPEDLDLPCGVIVDMLPLLAVHRCTLCGREDRQPIPEEGSE